MTTVVLIETAHRQVSIIDTTRNVLGKGAKSSQWQVQHFLPANVPFGVTNSATRLEYGQYELEILLQHVPSGLNRGKVSWYDTTLPHLLGSVFGENLQMTQSIFDHTVRVRNSIGWLDANMGKAILQSTCDTIWTVGVPLACPFQ